MAVCNALHSRGALEEARILDLFAGTGAFGIEAKSRGALSVTFVESQPKAIRLIRDNLERAGFANSPDVTVLHGSIPAVLSQLPEHDVAFADPPYEFSDWESLLAAVPVSLLVAEARSEVLATSGWESVRATRHGDTTLTFLQKLSK